jgi:hypothetical protein
MPFYDVWDPNRTYPLFAVGLIGRQFDPFAVACFDVVLGH